MRSSHRKASAAKPKLIELALPGLPREKILATLGGMTVKAAEEKLDKEIAEHATALHREERALLAQLEQRALLQQAS